MYNIIKTGIILVLPCIIVAKIQIKIQPGDTRYPQVVICGSDRAKATNIDMKAFRLDSINETLKDLECKPTEDLHERLNVKLGPKFATILRASDRIVKFDKKTIRNDGVGLKTINKEVVEDVTETMTTKWHDLKEISVGHDINHVIGINKIERSSAYGQDDMASRQITVQAENKDDVVLRPEEYVKIGLEVKQTTLEIRIDYEVTLDGEIAIDCVCSPSAVFCRSHQVFDIDNYFRLFDYSPVIKSFEIVTYTYYHDPKVSVGEVMGSPRDVQATAITLHPSS